MQYVLPNRFHSIIQKTRSSISYVLLFISFFKGKDSCGGDSGGPASYHKGNVTDSEPWFQIGIVSHGPKQCGTHGIPGVYIRIDRFTDWIQQKLEA